MNDIGRSEVDTDLCAALAAQAAVEEIRLPDRGRGATIILEMRLPTGEIFKRRYRERKSPLRQARAYRGEETSQGFPEGNVTKIEPVPYARLWRLLSHLGKNQRPRTLHDMLANGTATRTEEKLNATGPMEGMRAFHYTP